jgi:hypothetical protein
MDEMFFVVFMPVRMLAQNLRPVSIQVAFMQRADSR